MANPISTTGTTTDPVVTNYDPPELPRTWAMRHADKLKTMTPSGNTLTTTWTSSNGPQQCVTVRKAGESDAAFMNRHAGDLPFAMIGEEPVP